MPYIDQWRALSARICGLSEAAQLDSLYPQSGSWRYLRKQCGGVVLAVEAFAQQFGEELPPAALQAANEVLELKSALTPGANTQQLAWEGLRLEMQGAVIRLRAFESEMTFLLSDVQGRMRSLAERAFIHLNRLIVVDDAVRLKWQDAFAIGETKCEALGSVHLLQHGIFAFKVYAEGARTDLIFHEPILDGVEQFADAVVLTEWKIAKEDAKANASFAEARRQAQLYVDGPLAASELRNYRYAVVVTSRRVNVPGDLVQDGITYRHINIPVRPDSPSVDSKRY